MNIAQLIQKKNRAVLYLILAGLGVAFSIIGAGWLRYDAAWQLGVDREWIDHSQVVVSNIQRESQRIDRIEPALELYRLTGDEDKLHTAQTNSVALYSHAVQIERLVSDNPTQTRYAKQLADQTAALVKAASLITPQSPAPKQELLACRETVSLMLEAERDRLRVRMDGANTQAIRTTALSISVTIFSLVIVVVLFVFLIRDTLRAHEYQEKLSDANRKLSENVHTLERRAQEAELLEAARDELQFCTNSIQAQQSSALSLGKLLPGTRGAICLLNDSRRMVEIVARWNGSNSLIDGFPVESCCGLRSGHLRWRRQAHSEVHCTHFIGTPPENYLCMPMSAHGETLGIVYVKCSSDGVASMVEERMMALRELVEMTSATIAGLNLRNRLEQQSIRDGLTGLFNRHFMQEALERELRRATRQQSRVAMLMIDVDYFKQFNDDYGHEAGDAVLRQTADALSQAVRGEDIICRYGGEEFLAILPEISLDDARERAEVIRQIVRRIRVQFEGTALPEITVSIGVAVYPHHAASADQLLRAADRALYAAKQQGRNRVVINDPAAFGALTLKL